MRWFKPDGTSGKATTVPGGPGKVAVISVSPDDGWIAVALFDYTTKPVGETFYVEDFSGAKRVELRLNTNEYYWPVAWHGSAVVLARQNSAVASFPFTDPLPRGVPTDYRLLELAINTSPIGASFGPGLAPTDCMPSGSFPSSAGFVCTPSGGLGQHLVVRWSGESTAFMSNPSRQGGALSPDGTLIASCCHDGAGILIGSPTVGPRNTAAFGDVVLGGWVDATHVAFGVAGTPDIGILDTKTNTVLQPPSLREAMICDRLPAAR